MNIEYRNNIRKANKGKSNQVFSIKKVKNQKKWTKEEDELLVALAEKYHEKHWKEISKKFFKKNSLQCFSRYKRIRPGIIKGSWKKDEDMRIIDLVLKHGKSWSKISKIIGTRNGKQIRDRYINVLDPEIKKGKFTEEEDRKLILLFKQNGPKWATIAKYYPNRTADMIKNRFHSSIKKKLNLEGIPESKLFSKEFRDEIYASTKFESPLDDPNKQLCITSTISSTFNKIPNNNIMNNNFNFTINPSNKSQPDEIQFLENITNSCNSQTSNLANNNSVIYINSITDSGKNSVNPNPISTNNTNNYLIETCNNIASHNLSINRNLNYLNPISNIDNYNVNQDFSVVNNNINSNCVNSTNNNSNNFNINTSMNSQSKNLSIHNNNPNIQTNNTKTSCKYIINQTNNQMDSSRINTQIESQSNINLNVLFKDTTNDASYQNIQINSDPNRNQLNLPPQNKKHSNSSGNRDLHSHKHSHSNHHKKQKNFEMDIDNDENKNMNSTITSKDSEGKCTHHKKRENNEKDDFNYDILNLDMEINAEDSAYSNGNYIWNFEDYFTI